jgi:exonuclease SbcD
VTGHLTVAGADETKASERSILIGGEHAVPADVFPPEAAYVALGHLHKPQAIGRPTIRYSGSLFPLSATERDYQHAMTVIDVDGLKVTHRALPIPRPVPFLRVPTVGAAAPDAVAGLLAALHLPAGLSAADGPFVQLVVAVEGSGRVALVRADLARLIEALPIRLAGPIEFVRPDAARPIGLPATDPRRLSEFDPADLFRSAFEQTHDRPPTPAHESRFRDLLARQAAP